MHIPKPKSLTNNNQSYSYVDLAFVTALKSCNAWSRNGARATVHHPSEEARNAWITKRKAMALNLKLFLMLAAFQLARSAVSSWNFQMEQQMKTS